MTNQHETSKRPAPPVALHQNEAAPITPNPETLAFMGIATGVDICRDHAPNLVLYKGGSTRVLFVARSEASAMAFLMGYSAGREGQ